ncbi:hypothetical protein [Moraxella lacunata]|uniref:hypothetical protein n=1 Tax=Moraxella lacunata TaxID=477 RepID=UPI003EE3475D
MKIRVIPRLIPTKPIAILDLLLIIVYIKPVVLSLGRFEHQHRPPNLTSSMRLLFCQ